jgi:hypothetical protein
VTSFIIITGIAVLHYLKICTTENVFYYENIFLFSCYIQILNPQHILQFGRLFISRHIINLSYDTYYFAVSSLLLFLVRALFLSPVLWYLSLVPVPVPVPVSNLLTRLNFLVEMFYLTLSEESSLL